MGDAGVVDEDVEAAESLHAGRDHRVHVVLDRYIAGERNGRFADAGGHAGGTLRVAVGDHHFRTLAREGFGDAASEAGCRARDDGDFAVEPHRICAGSGLARALASRDRGSRGMCRAI